MDGDERSQLLGGGSAGKKTAAELDADREGQEAAFDQAAAESNIRATDKEIDAQLESVHGLMKRMKAQAGAPACDSRVEFPLAVASDRATPRPPQPSRARGGGHDGPGWRVPDSGGETILNRITLHASIRAVCPASASY